MTKRNQLIMAAMLDFYTVAYRVSPANAIPAEKIKLYDGEKILPIAEVLPMAETDGVIRVSQRLDLTKSYVLEIAGFGRKTVMPTRVFDCDDFIRDYTYAGEDLGAGIHGNCTTFKVWAPTASQVVLNLYRSGQEGGAYRSVEMTKAAGGVWQHTEECGHGTYYTYRVTTACGCQEAADPYARACGVNGDRSMVVDLALTDPEGWEKPYAVGADAYTKAVIWEIHVRDFSNRIASSQYPGKFLAFTERGLTNSAGVSVGVDHLLDLGITHVQLMPAFDYETVNEADSAPQFNWGYDPKNYNVPEGSYSTDPFRGEVRIREFKRMVQALHEVGIGVVMDVVYNHTYDANNALNRIVPYYYYRYTPEGRNSDATGCGNDTASERYMFRKFMVDSVCYWVKNFKLDGLRFDLMGLHDMETMKQIERAVHAIDPNALIYGEGWNMGQTMDGSAQANQGNIRRIHSAEGAAGSVAVFNDVIRDGLKGSIFYADSRGYINGNPENSVQQVKFGIAGGREEYSCADWDVEDHAVINYMSVHDNNTLWDKLALSNPQNTPQERLAMNRMGAAIMMVSLGTPLWQAGEEMLRSKRKADGTFDENSYRSPDAVNNLDWEALVPGSDAYEMMRYYQGLIAMRKSVPVFTARGGVHVEFTDLPGGGLIADLAGENSVAKIVINPTDSALAFDLKGEWNLLADITRAGAAPIRVDRGKVELQTYGILVYVK